jgi:hypothetical protein
VQSEQQVFGLEACDQRATWLVQLDVIERGVHEC